MVYVGYVWVAVIWWIIGYFIIKLAVGKAHQRDKRRFEERVERNQRGVR